MYSCMNSWSGFFVPLVHLPLHIFTGWWAVMTITRRILNFRNSWNDLQGHSRSSVMSLFDSWLIISVLYNYVSCLVLLPRYFHLFMNWELSWRWKVLQFEYYGRIMADSWRPSLLVITECALFPFLPSLESIACLISQTWPALILSHLSFVDKNKLKLSTMNTDGNCCRHKVIAVLFLTMQVLMKWRFVELYCSDLALCNKKIWCGWNCLVLFG